MGKKIKVMLGTGHTLEKTGVFNFNKLYEEMKDWINNHNFLFNEKKYRIKDKPTGKEMEITWEAERNATEYIKYYFKIDFDVKKLIQVSDSMQKGFIRITFSASLELDYKNQWRQTKSSNFLFNIYNKYFIKTEINKHSGLLYNETMDLHDIAKDILEFYK